MRLIVVRHGETEENVLGIIQGHLPGTLSKRGIVQAKNLAVRLKAERIDCIYSSDLARALDTARVIAKFHPSVPLILSKLLREKYLGGFQGKTVEALGGLSNPRVATFSPEDGESWDDVLKRAKKFLRNILKNHSRGTVLLVGHNGFNKAIRSVITGVPLDPLEVSENASVSIFEVDRKV